MTISMNSFSIFLFLCLSLPLYILVSRIPDVGIGQLADGGNCSK